jgi:hypothetical protein
MGRFWLVSQRDYWRSLYVTNTSHFASQTGYLAVTNGNGSQEARCFAANCLPLSSLKFSYPPCATLPSAYLLALLAARWTLGGKWELISMSHLVQRLSFISRRVLAEQLKEL